MVVMNTGHLRNKARSNIKKRNCGRDLTFDPGSVGCKDGFWSASRASHAELENPLRIEKALKAMPGLSGGRQLFRMKTQPSSKVKAIHGRDLDCRQNMIVDQHSMYGKVDASLPCPTGSTNENPVSGQNSLMLNESMVNDVSETGNSLSVVDCLPSTSGKAVGGESNCTQKRSCNRGIEDNRPKILYTSQAKGASTIDSETSTICINATHEKRKESVVCKNGNLHGMDMFQGSGFNSQVVKECPVSEGLLFPILEKPEKQTKQEVTREQGKHMSHKEGASSCPENLKLESFGHRNKNESLFKRDLGALFTDSGVRLTEILEGLASLDNNGFFSNAMENPFVVDHPRISRKNICFSVMREKIQSKNYETWRSFVDDFEDICHNAMNNHEKGSRIWDAANTLLYEGKKYLEQYADRALAFFGLSTKVEHRRTCGVEASNNGHCIKLDKVGHTVHQEGECSFSQSNKELIGTVSHGKCSNFPNQKSVNPLSRRDMTVLPPDERLQNVSGSTLVCTQNMVYVPEEDCRSNPEYTFDANEVNEEANDSIVEILEEIGDDIRSNPSEQATECSSSFGDIQLDTDDDDAGCKMYDAAEVQSESRNGNGAAIPSEDNTSRKRKKALSDEWKDYRRGYEWRCQWLELQVKELLSQASKYDHIVANIQARKLQKNERLSMDALSTRSSSQIDHSRRHRILQRKRRKKIESTVDFSAYMSHHPLFSLYDKKRLDAEAVSPDDDPNGMSGIVDVNDAGLDENDLEDPLRDGDNSVEQTLVLIETLQSRIIKMKNQLNKFYSRKSGKFTPRNISTNLVTADSKYVENISPSLLDSTRIQAPVGEGLKLQAESNLSHQQNSDFDLSHSVMPCNGIPPSVDLAQNEFIETSERHLLDNDAVLEQPEKEDSSEEVACEEAHKEHDAIMEAKEKKNQDICSQDTKHFEGEGILGKRVFQQQQATGATEKDVEPIEGENIANICLPFDLFVPKCKRRKTHSRSSSLQRVESLHVEERNSSSMQEIEMHEVKMENGGDLSGDGIGDHL